MKIAELNENGSRLKVRPQGDFYAFTLYQSFNSKKELTQYVKDFFGTTKYEYWY